MGEAVLARTRAQEPLPGAACAEAALRMEPPGHLGPEAQLVSPAGGQQPPAGQLRQAELCGVP